MRRWIPRSLARPSLGGLGPEIRLRDEQRKCIVFSTHVMQEVERLCDHVVVMAAGRTVADGSVPGLCGRCGTNDFEQAFVQLAFGGSA